MRYAPASLLAVAVLAATPAQAQTYCFDETQRVCFSGLTITIGPVDPVTGIRHDFGLTGFYRALDGLRRLDPSFQVVLRRTDGVRTNTWFSSSFLLSLLPPGSQGAIQQTYFSPAVRFPTAISSSSSRVGSA